MATDDQAGVVQNQYAKLVLPRCDESMRASPAERRRSIADRVDDKRRALIANDDDVQPPSESNANDIRREN